MADDNKTTGKVADGMFNGTDGGLAWLAFDESKICAVHPLSREELRLLNAWFLSASGKHKYTREILELAISANVNKHAEDASADFGYIFENITDWSVNYAYLDMILRCSQYAGHILLTGLTTALLEQYAGNTSRMRRLIPGLFDIAVYAHGYPEFTARPQTTARWLVENIATDRVPMPTSTNEIHEIMDTLDPEMAGRLTARAEGEINRLSEKIATAENIFSGGDRALLDSIREINDSLLQTKATLSSPSYYSVHYLLNLMDTLAGHAGKLDEITQKLADAHEAPTMAVPLRPAADESRTVKLPAPAATDEAMTQEIKVKVGSVQETPQTLVFTLPEGYRVAIDAASKGIGFILNNEMKNALESLVAIGKKDPHHKNADGIPDGMTAAEALKVIDILTKTEAGNKVLERYREKAKRAETTMKVPMDEAPFSSLALGPDPEVIRTEEGGRVVEITLLDAHPKIPELVISTADLEDLESPRPGPETGPETVQARELVKGILISSLVDYLKNERGVGGARPDHPMVNDFMRRYGTDEMLDGLVTIIRYGLGKEQVLPTGQLRNPMSGRPQNGRNGAGQPGGKVRT